MIIKKKQKKNKKKTSPPLIEWASWKCLLQLYLIDTQIITKVELISRYNNWTHILDCFFKIKVIEHYKLISFVCFKCTAMKMFYGKKPDMNEISCNILKTITRFVLVHYMASTLMSFDNLKTHITCKTIHRMRKPTIQI